jgi:hypothetical protein
MYSAAIVFANLFGPTLQIPAALTLLMVSTCVIGTIYNAGQKNFLAAWRCLYLTPAVALGFVAYLNSGFTWIENHVMATAIVEERFHALRDQSLPPPSAEWIAEVKRDWTVARAQKDYAAKLAELGQSSATPFPRAVTPWLYVGSVLFLLLALLPAHWIRAAIAELQHA